MRHSVLLVLVLFIAGSAVAEFKVLTDTTATPIMCVDVAAPLQLTCGLCSKYGLKSSADTTTSQSKFEAVCTQCSNGKTPTTATEATWIVGTGAFATAGYKLNLTQSCVITASSRAYLPALSLAIIGLLFASL